MAKKYDLLEKMIFNQKLVKVNMFDKGFFKNFYNEPKI